MFRLIVRNKCLGLKTSMYGGWNIFPSHTGVFNFNAETWCYFTQRVRKCIRLLEGRGSENYSETQRCESKMK